MTEGAATPAVPDDGGSGQDFDEVLAGHPEIYVGGAFAGGLALALALRLLGR